MDVLPTAMKLVLKMLAPYLAVGIFWCGLSNAWLAILAYHAQIQPCFTITVVVADILDVIEDQPVTLGIVEIDVQDDVAFLLQGRRGQRIARVCE